MGRETECRVVLNGQAYSGKALLETDEIIFRGDIRLKIPRNGISHVQAADGELLITYKDGSAIFELGRNASRWADKILHPPTRVDKFGIAKGTGFTKVGVIDSDFLNELNQAGVREQENAEVVLLGAADKPALSGISSFHGKTVWIIYPKGIKSITEADVLLAGRDAGFVDIKVVGFSQSHTALKFVPKRKAS